MDHHHILIASRQLWPNIMGLLHVARVGDPPDKVWILHTAAESVSRAPARRLARLINDELLLSADIRLRELQEDTPGEVEKVIANIRREASQDARWTINSTGGLKLLFAGILPQIHQPRTDVFYLDINGQWYTLLPPGNGVNDHQSVLRVEKRDVEIDTDTVPVLALMQTQDDDSMNELHWRGDPLPAIPRSALLPIFKTGIQTDWDWKTLGAEYPQLHVVNNQSGFVFEKFFGSLVRLYMRNKRQAIMNAKLIFGEQKGQTKEELDIVVNAGGRIVVFDLKTTGKASTPRIDQLAKVASNIRRLGGINSAGVLVRPSWIRDAGLTSLAKYFRIEIWTQSDMRNVFPNLARIFGMPLPNSVLDPHLFLQNVPENRKIFSPPKPVKKKKKPKKRGLRHSERNDATKAKPFRRSGRGYKTVFSSVHREQQQPETKE